MSSINIYITPINLYLKLQGIDNICPKRREKINDIKRPEDKARALVAGLQLKKFCGVTNDDQLGYEEKGKPYLKNNDLFFNISHSGDFVVLATASHIIGVDLEKISPYNFAVAKHCFTQNELEWLINDGRIEAFYHVWTAKESIMKAIGQGLLIPPKSFCVIPIKDSPHFVAGESWYLDLKKFKEHIICSASNVKHDIINILYVEKLL